MPVYTVAWDNRWSNFSQPSANLGSSLSQQSPFVNNSPCQYPFHFPLILLSQRREGRSQYHLTVRMSVKKQQWCQRHDCTMKGYINKEMMLNHCCYSKCFESTHPPVLCLIDGIFHKHCARFFLWAVCRVNMTIHSCTNDSTKSVRSAHMTKLNETTKKNCLVMVCKYMRGTPVEGSPSLRRRFRIRSRLKTRQKQAKRWQPLDTTEQDPRWDLKLVLSTFNSTHQYCCYSHTLTTTKRK